MNLDELHERFTRHLYITDPSMLDFIAAVAIANRMGGDPVWAFIVAPPSSGKTEALQSLTRLKEVHPLSSLTPSTFLSGKKKGESGPEPSLLLRLGTDKILMLKDFGTILSMREDARAEILGQLREIYDGSLVKEFGTGASLRWDGRMAFIAGTTTAIDQHHAVISILGERFLYFREAEQDRRSMGQRALLNTLPEEMRDDLQAAMFEYVNQFQLLERQELPGDVLETLVSLADIGTWGRSSVYRNPYSRDIEVAPSREAPARFAKQLASLWRALDAMEHHDPMGLVFRVALDSMPPSRAAVLRHLGQNGPTSSTDLRKVSRLSRTAHTRLLEDLEVLELLEIAVHAVPDSGTPHIWDLTFNGRRTWSLANPNPNLSTPSRNNGGEGVKEEIDSGSVIPGAGPPPRINWAALEREVVQDMQLDDGAEYREEEREGAP